MKKIQTDICVIGGGSGGLSVAAGASQMGAKVVLCEGGKMGGDCLNYGCIPSKAMIEAARSVYHAKRAKAFGIDIDTIKVDYQKVQAHVRNVIATIEPHDSVERFEKLGVTVIQAYAKMLDRHTVQAGNTLIKAKYIVLATGSRAKIFPIEGLDQIDYLTNETIFTIKEQPKRLLIIGGGPIGAELAQAHALLGSKVTLFDAGKSIMGNADEECKSFIINEFKNLGIDIINNARIQKVSKDSQGTITIHNENDTHIGSHLLVATGRTPNIEKLNLRDAGIAHTERGVNVNSCLRTNFKNVYAIGDLASPYQFTHTASYHAGIVIQNILFKLPTKVDYSSFPWVIYTTPELVHTGMSIKEAKAQGASILQLSYTDNDRAQAGLHTNGMIKVAVGKKGVILGATIVGENAGELITQWTMAIKHKLKIKQMAGHIVPYPTLSELNKRIASSYFTPMLYSTKTQKLVQWLMRWL